MPTPLVSRLPLDGSHILMKSNIYRALSLWQHRRLISRLAWREITGRYRGSVAGLVWSLITPILLLAVYTVVFAGIFQARWSQGGSSLEYALQLFAGLIVHGMIAECLNTGPTLIVGKSNLVKRVMFPLDVLPLVGLLSAVFHALMSLAVLVVFAMVVKQQLPLTILWLPIVWLPYLVFLAGLGWLLAALGVYLRDISQVMALLATILLFMSPVLYPITLLPETLHIFFRLNPLTVIIEQTRLVVLGGTAPAFWVLGLYLGLALVWARLCLAAFDRMRAGFADVL